MTALIEVEIQNTRDADPTSLVTFFEMEGNSTIRRSFIAPRGDPTGIVQIILIIVGTWAAERYLLDPFADKLEEWTEAATSLRGKQFKISVRFQNGQLFSIETLRISSFMIVKNLWRTIKSANELLASIVDKSPLDRILIVPDKSDQPLIIGYQGTRPTHLLDLSSAKITPIKIQDERLLGDIDKLLPYLEGLQIAEGPSEE